jgi:catechol 2,3-dioxygenase-like lactoylglutathione lyase family enzyme
VRLASRGPPSRGAGLNAVIEGLDHVQLAAPAGCEEAARAFYGQLLGLREVPKPAPLLARGGVWFELSDRRQIHIGVERPFAPALKAHPALRVDASATLQALAQALASAGHEPRWDQDLPGVMRFYVDDPFGNRLELTLAGA